MSDILTVGAPPPFVIIPFLHIYYRVKFLKICSHLTCFSHYTPHLINLLCLLYTGLFKELTVLIGFTNQILHSRLKIKEIFILLAVYTFLVAILYLKVNHLNSEIL